MNSWTDVHENRKAGSTVHRTQLHIERLLFIGRNVKKTVIQSRATSFILLAARHNIILRSLLFIPIFLLPIPMVFPQQPCDHFCGSSGYLFFFPLQYYRRLVNSFFPGFLYFPISRTSLTGVHPQRYSWTSTCSGTVVHCDSLCSHGRSLTRQPVLPVYTAAL